MTPRDLAKLIDATRDNLLLARIALEAQDEQTASTEITTASLRIRRALTELKAAA